MASQKISQKYLEQIKKLCESHKDLLKYLARLLMIVLVYGLMVAYILYQLLKYPIGIQSIIAFGLCAYIIKVEVPAIVAASIPRRPPMIPIS